MERCERYDDYPERQLCLHQEKERREMHKRHAKIWMLGQNIGVRVLEDLLNRIQNGQAQVTPSEAARLLGTSIKVERQAGGESTDHQDLNDPLAKLLAEFQREYDGLPGDPDADS